MMQKFQKMLEKKSKGEKPLSDMEKEAKMSVIDEMRKMADDQMGGKLDGLKKVTVAANSKPGLAEGLDKAKQILGHGEEGSDDEEASESPEMEQAEEETHEDLDGDNEEGESPEHQEAVLGHEAPNAEDMTEDSHPDEIDKKIQELLALKEHIKSKM